MESLSVYGFKLNTETRQYFISCYAQSDSRDSRFIMYAYDKIAQIHDHEIKTSVVNQLRDNQAARKSSARDKQIIGKKNTEPEL